MRIQLRELDGRPDDGLAASLAAAWRGVHDAGAIAYDPARVEILRAERLTLLYLPGRLERPDASGGEHPLGLLKPHVRCPFDEPRILETREVARFHRDGRTYHLIANKYPVARSHFLAVRSGDEPAETLPQCIFGAAELDDMLRLTRALGPSYRLFFNANAGADGSSSGSSVNHWHFHVFPYERDVLETLPRHAARIPHWPAHHRLHSSDDTPGLAEALWRDIDTVRARNGSFNLALHARPDGQYSAALFPRAAIAPVPFGPGHLASDFGGFELTGAVVLYDAPCLEWAREHPHEAEAVALDRLARGTRDVE